MSGLLYNRGISIEGYVIVGGDDYFLLCFKQGDSLIYQNPSFDDCYDINTNSRIIHEPEKIKIYPNPFNHQITIEGLPNTKTSIELYDLYGRIVYTATVYTEMTEIINASIIKTGIYFIRIKDIESGQIFAHKILVKK